MIKKNTMIKIGILLILINGIAQADIYDDYKLLASGIVENNTNIHKLDFQNQELKQKIANLEKIVKAMRTRMICQGKKGCKVLTIKKTDLETAPQEILAPATRKKLIKIEQTSVTRN